MRRTAAASLFLALLFPTLARGQQNQTLAEVLKQNSIAVDSRATPHHLNDAITSYATLNTDTEFLIAFYLGAPGNELHFPLILARLDKQAGKWQEAPLNGLQVNLCEGTGRQTNDDCLGGADHIARNENWYYLGLSLSPSAECLVVLNGDLTVYHTLAGWTAAFFKSGLLVYEGNMVHFAPVHPETLFLYDPATKNSQQIYPPKNDPIRAAFSERLKKIIDEKRCQENDWPCDPSEFESIIYYPLEVNDESHSLAFRVAFDTQGFLPPQEAKSSGEWEHDQYVYVFQFDPPRWREFRADEVKAKFGSDSLKELLTPEKLGRLFATPEPR